MLKRLVMICVLVTVAFHVKVNAEVAILLDLKEGDKRLIVRETGDYFIDLGDFQVGGSGRLIWKGCGASMEDVQPTYRIVVVGDSCNGTGKAVVQIFGLGTFTIFDRTRNGEN